MNIADMSEEDRLEAIEHRDMLLDLRAILKTTSGMKVFKYFFKHFGVGELPELGLPNEILLDKLGYLRAGNAMFKLLSEADPIVSGNILANIEKEKNERIYRQD